MRTIGRATVSLALSVPLVLGAAGVASAGDDGSYVRASQSVSVSSGHWDDHWGHRNWDKHWDDKWDDDKDRWDHHKWNHHHGKWCKHW